MRCPGEGCRIWEATAGDYDEKIASKVCDDCTECGGEPPLAPGEGEDTDDELEQINEIIAEIEDIAIWHDAGFETDWSVYPFETRALVRVWRQAEAEVTRIRSQRLQMFMKGFFKEK